MKLTKEERFALYCIMHRELDYLKSDRRFAYFCYMLATIFGYYNPLYGCKALKRLPELNKRKPRLPYSKLEWFRSYDFVSRKKILLECINELGNELYAEQ